MALNNKFRDNTIPNWCLHLKLIIPFNKLISLQEDNQMLGNHSTEGKDFQKPWNKRKKFRACLHRNPQPPPAALSHLNLLCARRGWCSTPFCPEVLLFKWWLISLLYSFCSLTIFLKNNLKLYFNIIGYIFTKKYLFF